MHKEMPSPVDLPDPLPDDGAGLGWGTGVIVVAALLLLAINAVSLRDWIDDMPPSPLQARAAGVAEQWLELTRAAGVARPRDALHDGWKQVEAARFPEPSGGDAPR
jgi:hypothetical protein